MNMRGKEKEICIQLELHKKHHEGKLIAVIENQNGHANFVLSTILDYNLKNNVGVCFISLFNPLSHYQHVGLKLGYNLKSAIEKGQVKFTDTLSVTKETLLGNDSTTHMLLGENLVQWLLKQVTLSLEDLFKCHDSVFLFMDDINVLLSLDIELKQVQAFLHYLQVLAVKPSEERSDKSCSVVVLAHSDPSDEEGLRLAASVLHASGCNVNVTEARCIVSHASHT